jgi:hypothetical protein
MFRLGSASMALAALVALGGCSSISMAASPSERVRAAQLPVYMAGQNDAPPAAWGDLGSIEGYACKPQRDFLGMSVRNRPKRLINCACGRSKPGLTASSAFASQPLRPIAGTSAFMDWPPAAKRCRSAAVDAGQMLECSLE